MDPIVSILAILITAAIAGELLSYLRIPRVVGQIGAGILLGIPVIKQALFDSAGLSLIANLADIGVILLLFFTGLEVNFTSFKKNIKIATNISFWNTTLPLVAGYLVSRYLFNLDPAVSFIVGISLSVSATALALDILEDLNMLKTKLGALIVSAGAVDDLYELMLITLVVSFIETVAAKTAILSLILNVLVFVAIVVMFKLLVVPFILKLVVKKKESTLLMAGLIITLLMASLSDYLGFGSLIGALISGIIVRQTLVDVNVPHKPWRAYNISKGIHLIAFGFLVPVFFVHVGMLMDLTAILENLLFTSVITFIALFGTVIGCAIGYYILKKNWNEGLLIGWALAGKGDTEIVIATIALEAGIITSVLFSNLIFMALITTLVSPLIFQKLILNRVKVRSA